MLLETRQKRELGWNVHVYQNPYWRDHHFTPNQLLKGCVHVSEMKPFFHTPLPCNYTMDEDDLKHKQALVQSHVNFIKNT